VKARPFAAVCVAMALVLLACVAAVGPGGLSGAAASMVINGVQVFGAALALAGFLWTALHSPGGDRRWRWWMVCSSASLTIGMLAWTWGQLVVGTPLPTASLAPLGFIMTAVFLLPAVLAMAAGGHHADSAPTARPRNRALLALDGVILAGALTILVSGTLSERGIRSIAWSVTAVVTVVAHPAAYLVVIVVMIVLVANYPAARRSAMWVLLAAALTQSASGWTVAYLLAHGAPAIPAWTDTGFMAAQLLFALAPWAPRPTASAAAVGSRPTTAAYLHLFVPFIPLAVTWGFVAVATANGVTPSAVNIYLGLGVVSLVSLRQLLTSVDNLQLVQSLNTSRSELAHQASHDSVTGLANSAAFHDRLAATAKPLVLLFIDVDDFKSVNDRFGHAIGDAVLRAIGQRLTDCVRECDMVARLGGDEFGVLVNSPTVEPDELGRRVLSHLNRPYAIAGMEHMVRVSIGMAVSTQPEPAVSGDTLLSQADVAMYAAKRAGKGTLVVA